VTWGRSIAEHRERRAAEKAAHLAVLMLPTRSLHRGTYEGAVSGVAVPKGAKAKPGKGAPTKAEREWLDAIVAHGCIACRMDGRGYVPACVHHILRGSVRMGHLYSLPLCAGHHQHDTTSGLIARHPYKARFEAHYGFEMDLLLKLQQELGFPALWEVL
jgi:hypothetical protein